MMYIISDPSGHLALKNRVHRDGQFIKETDTGILKVGDGVTPYNDLEPIGGGGIGFAPFTATIAEDGSGDYTTFQAAYDDGVRLFGLKGQYDQSVSGGLVIDNSTLSDVNDMPLMGIYGTDETAEVILDDSGSFVSWSNSITDIKGQVSISSAYSGNYSVITSQDATDFDVLGVLPGMRISFRPDSAGDDRSGAMPVEVISVAGTAITVERISKTYSNALVEYEAAYTLSEGFQIKNVILTSSTTTQCKFLGLNKVFMFHNEYENVKAKFTDYSSAAITLTHGPGRHWHVTAKNCKNIQGASYFHESDFFVDLGNFGTAINCSHIRMGYYTGNMYGTWIGCLVYKQYFDDSNGHGTLIGCSFIDKTDTTAFSGLGFKLISCSNEAGEPIDDPAEPTVSSIWTNTAITGNIDLVPGVNNFISESSGARSATINNPAAHDQPTVLFVSAANSVTLTGFFYDETAKTSYSTLTVTGVTGYAGCTLVWMSGIGFVVIIKMGGDGTVVLT